MKNAGETSGGETDKPEKGAEGNSSQDEDGERVSLSIPKSTAAGRFRARLQRLSLTSTQNPGNSPSQTNPPAGTKDSTSANEMSGKQEGPSNSDTSHPVPSHSHD